jgi:hypothetical protein
MDEINPQTAGRCRVGNVGQPASHASTVKREPLLAPQPLLYTKGFCAAAAYRQRYIQLRSQSDAPKKPDRPDLRPGDDEAGEFLTGSGREDVSAAAAIG